ncbi:MAG TPA: response regulator transcription factor [Microbacteriaceae bacterium]|nr:response regulator transcription factor [Microbacteriaceae bacterium]
MTRLLVVEDEKAIAEPLGYLLEREGYTITSAADGPAALAAFRDRGADLVLLDLMLPGMSGHDVCRTIRATSRVPIIMLTAKDSETDIVVGLELGADDYVTKPYSSKELLARIAALLRRDAGGPGFPKEDAFEGGAGGAQARDPDTVAAHGIRLDVASHTVLVEGRETPMPLKEFDLLELLLRNAGRVLTRGQLIDRVWGSDYHGDTKTLDVHIRRLRSRVEPDPRSPCVITTVRGVGYRLNP